MRLQQLRQTKAGSQVDFQHPRPERRILLSKAGYPAAQFGGPDEGGIVDKNVQAEASVGDKAGYFFKFCCLFQVRLKTQSRTVETRSDLRGYLLQPVTILVDQDEVRSLFRKHARKR